MLRLRNFKGFTLVELILVILIIGILAGIVIPRISYTTTQARDEACQANRHFINGQVELYHQLEGAWPVANLTDIGTDNDYFPEGLPDCPVTPATPYTLDAATHRVTGHARGASPH